LKKKLPGFSSSLFLHVKRLAKGFERHEATIAPDGAVLPTRRKSMKRIESPYVLAKTLLCVETEIPI